MTANTPPRWEDLFRKKPQNFNTLSCDGANQLIVYQKGQLIVENIQKFINEVVEKTDNEDIQLVSMCEDCNSSLLVFAGQAIEDYIFSQIAGGPGNRRNAGTVQGWGDSEKGFLFSSNVKIWLPDHKLDPVKTSDKKSGDCKRPTRETIKIAVFDTGARTKEIQELLLDDPNPCIKLATYGWNFTVPNAVFEDDNPGEHGSNVTQYIVNKITEEDTVDINIIPVKIHNRAGKSDLYSILCGLAYAAHRKVNIVNGSFGYFAPLETEKDINVAQKYGATLFREFINDNLVANKIIFVVAAGNEAKRDEVLTDFRNLYPMPDDVKDLDQISFYPACFARKPALNPKLELTDVSDYVIAVTTVSEKTGDTVSPHQNFSPSVVDVGIRGEVRDFQFFNPRYYSPDLEGSSFATPKMTGLIAAYYGRFEGRYDKKNIIDILLKLEKLRINRNVANKIRNGVIDNFLPPPASN
jgi:Subtilase family